MAAPTVIEAVPLLPAVGVKVAVRVRPLPEMAERVPPETLTSPLLPSQTKLLPGSREKEKVMVALSPTLRLAVLLLIETLAAVVPVRLLVTLVRKKAAV